MAKGFCSSCKKEIGGFLGPSVWECPGCKKYFCRDCGPKAGLIFKVPTCPDCGRELRMK